MDTSGTSRLIVGITGATGSIFGVRLLEALAGAEVETHLVISKWGAATLLHETPYSVEQVERLASRHYSPQDQGAAISSGSFLTRGMVVAPCSMRTVAAIATGQGEHLVHRAADVVLKERRKLVLVAREAPLSEIHLENLYKLARMGVVIIAPGAGLLQSSPVDRGDGRPYCHADSGPVRHSPGSARPLGWPYAGGRERVES
jgi:4-hydroxy-3-polyprenylbenzoate decarboxylase